MLNAFRFAFFGFAVGLVVAALPGCTKKCDASTCDTGCCSAAGECQTGNAVDACGVGAASCQRCNGGECNAGICSNGAITTDAGVSEVLDAGYLACVTDDECAVLHNGSVCDTRTGTCAPGRGCNDVSSCQFSDPTDPCYQFGTQCRCDLRDSPDTTTQGTCRRRRAACETCQVDAECGDSAVIFGPPDGIGFGKCRAMTGDTSGAKYCLYQRVGACKCGTAPDTEGLCRPVNNSCTDVGCRNDKNCPTGSVCTVNLPDDVAGACGGICKPRCRWNFDFRELAMPGCPPGQTCWVDSENLDAGSRYYGAGRCQAPCDDSTQCQQTLTNPWGASALVCVGEKLKSGALDAKRCRPDGECMDDFECPTLPTDEPPLGYCDRGTRTCKSDCRVGIDPFSGNPYRDCRPPYACSLESGRAQCKLLTCAQQGGASLACVRGQYCCGEDKNGDGVADPCPPLTEQDAAGCYNAPRPPFCQSCQNNNGCQNPTLPAYLNGACANGSKAPSCSLLPSLCVPVTTSSSGEPLRVCAIATANDDTRINGRLKYQLGCPQGYEVHFIRHDFAPDDDANSCQSDADCNQGTTQGKCEPDPELRLGDGGLGLSCRCEAGSGKTMCPNSPKDGLATECRAASSGRTFCIESVVCLPPGGIVRQAPGAPYYGCGL